MAANRSDTSPASIIAAPARSVTVMDTTNPYAQKGMPRRNSRFGSSRNWAYIALLQNGALIEYETRSATGSDNLTVPANNLHMILVADDLFDSIVCLQLDDRRYLVRWTKIMEKGVSRYAVHVSSTTSFEREQQTKNAPAIFNVKNHFLPPIARETRISPGTSAAAMVRASDNQTTKHAPLADKNIAIDTSGQTGPNDDSIAIQMTEDSAPPASDAQERADESDVEIKEDAAEIEPADGSKEGDDANVDIKKEAVADDEDEIVSVSSAESTPSMAAAIADEYIDDEMNVAPTDSNDPQSKIVEDGRSDDVIMTDHEQNYDSLAFNEYCQDTIECAVWVIP